MVLVVVVMLVDIATRMSRLVKGKTLSELVAVQLDFLRLMSRLFTEALSDLCGFPVFP